MSLRVEKAGMFDTVQDLGRNGYGRFGISCGGAMDRLALRVANILLGNEENEAALELHFPAASLRFEESAIAVVSGADFSANLDGEDLSGSRPFVAKSGSLLSFQAQRSGSRAYLAIRNGFKLSPVLGSKSTDLAAHFGGFHGRPLLKDDTLQFDEPHSLHLHSTPAVRPPYGSRERLRFVPGAGFRDLTAISELTFRKSVFEITNDSNRMGYRLSGPALSRLGTEEMLSTAVTFGTIQLLPDGGLVILMADHQTTGGYPIIGTIVDADLPMLAQMGPGMSFEFEPVSVGRAEELNMQFERELALLRAAVKHPAFGVSPGSE